MRTTPTKLTRPWPVPSSQVDTIQSLNRGGDLQLLLFELEFKIKIVKKLAHLSALCVTSIPIRAVGSPATTPQAIGRAKCRLLICLKYTVCFP